VSNDEDDSEHETAANDAQHHADPNNKQNATCHLQHEWLKTSSLENK